MAINDKLKQLRKSRGLTQEEAADIFGVSISSYQKYERDKGCVTPSLDVLIRIADYYKVSVDFLLGRENGEQTALDELAGQFNMSMLEKEIVKGYLELPDDMRENLMDFLDRTVRKGARESSRIWRAAESSDDHAPEISALTPEEKKLFDEAPNETENPDNDL